MLQVNKSLTHLDPSNSSTFSDSGARCIFEGLRHNATLANLNLSQTVIAFITPVTARSLTNMLQVNKNLRHLDLSYTSAFASYSGARCIFKGLQHNTTLVNLNLSHTGIKATDPDTARSLTKMLQVNKSLTHLDLSKNRLLDSGARCIFEGLQHNTTLVNLNLSHTGIKATDPDTARFLTKMLQVNKSLTHLDLSKNRLLDSGARCIFEGLQNNTTLVNLNLHTGIEVIDPDTARSLTKMLQVNKSLTHLDLSNYFTHEFTYLISYIFEGLEHNTSLCYLDLHVVSPVICKHGDNAAEHIARALKSNRSLLTLDIAGWIFLGPSGIHPILESLMFNSTLQTLYISDIDSETLSTFKRAREAKNLPPIEVHTS